MSEPAPVKFNRRTYFPDGWEICTAEFLELFHRYGYIYKSRLGGSWYSADESWKLSDSEILKAIACAHPKFYIGCRAGKSSSFAVLDIDAKSKYHNKQHMQKLLNVLAGAGLTKSSLYRSSYSGGWHLYIFFDEPINSADLRKQLVKLLTLHDFQIAKGTLEIFPHKGENSLGMGLRLPLQPGWAWLSRQTLEVEHERDSLDATIALELFIDALNGDANSYAAFCQLKSYVDELESRKEIAKGHIHKVPKNNLVLFGRKPQNIVQTGECVEFVVSVFHELPPGIIPDNWYRGREFHLNGLTGPSQRAEAITSLSHYLFYGDPSRALPALGYGYEQEREWAIHEFLSLKHNGHSEDINRGHSDAIAQIERAAHWRPTHKKNDESLKYIANVPIAWVRENANRKLDARKRIKAAFDMLATKNRPFTISELQQQSACSKTTLYKHLDIWRQQYEDLASGLFAISTHEYNVFDGAACSESKPHSESHRENTPPGLLATKRVVYEISMRAQREKKQKQQEAIRSRRACENDWQDKIACLTSQPPNKLPAEKLKTLISVLSFYLSVAPNFDDALSLKQHIDNLREELHNRMLGPKPPPDK